MSAEREASVLTGIYRRGYQKIFYENWPIWLGAVLVGILSVLTFAWARPWGIVGGLRNWGDWIFHYLGIFKEAPAPPLTFTSSILTLGFLWGAFGSALMSKQFAIRMAPPFELLKGCVGGILMGVGSAMAGGCNVGGFYSALSALSASGLAMMVGLLMGAYLGLRYLYWEIEHLSSGGVGSDSPPSAAKGFSLLAIEPYVGAIVLLGAFVAAWIYSREAYTALGGLLLCGLGFGVIIQRTRLCFVRAFRDPFMTGEGTVARGIALSLIISILGFSALKWTGLRGEAVYVPQAFWFGALVGGIIFGFGMLLSGGCGSGSLWRAGEGHVKLILAVVFFMLTLSLVEAWINGSEALTALMGYAVFLPNVICYGSTTVLLILLMVAWYLMVTWNEETEKFLVDM